MTRNTMPAEDAKEIRVIAEIVARSENVASVRTVLKNMLVPTRAEKGCIAYDLHEVLGDPHQFVFFEIWKSKAALEAHTRTPHFRELERAQSLLTEPLKITKLRRLPG
jgi:quinol monooxygenase YgiN